MSQYEKITLKQVEYLGESWATDEINELREEVARLGAVSSENEALKAAIQRVLTISREEAPIRWVQGLLRMSLEESGINLETPSAEAAGTAPEPR